MKRERSANEVRNSAFGVTPKSLAKHTFYWGNWEVHPPVDNCSWFCRSRHCLRRLWSIAKSLFQFQNPARRSGPVTNGAPTPGPSFYSAESESWWFKSLFIWHVSLSMLGYMIIFVFNYWYITKKAQTTHSEHLYTSVSEWARLKCSTNRSIDLPPKRGRAGFICERSRPQGLIFNLKRSVSFSYVISNIFDFRSIGTWRLSLLGYPKTTFLSEQISKNEKRKFKNVKGSHFFSRRSFWVILSLKSSF